MREKSEGRNKRSEGKKEGRVVKKKEKKGGRLIKELKFISREINSVYFRYPKSFLSNSMSFLSRAHFFGKGTN
ncbi:MAG: hypothetical protein WA064_02390 [Candidatus Moraniibacteriota bacterium]